MGNRFEVHEFSRVTGYYFCVMDTRTKEPFGAWGDQADAQAEADRRNTEHRQKMIEANMDVE